MLCNKSSRSAKTQEATIWADISRLCNMWRQHHIASIHTNTVSFSLCSFRTQEMDAALRFVCFSFIFLAIGVWFKKEIIVVACSAYYNILIVIMRQKQMFGNVAQERLKVYGTYFGHSKDAPHLRKKNVHTLTILKFIRRFYSAKCI